MQSLARNRAPCGNCKTSKRKCDRARSRCSRCRHQNLACVPSTTARWRVDDIDSASQRIRSHRSSKKQTRGRVTPPDVAPVEDPDLFLANDESAFPDLDGIFEDFQSAENAFMRHGEFDDLLCLSPSSHPEAEFQPRGVPVLNDPVLNTLLPCATSYLWQEFIQSIAPGITIDNQQQNNQVTKYFASNAAGRPSLFSAIIFLSYSIRSNWMIQYPALIDMTEVTTAALKMEQQAVSYISDVMSRDADQSTHRLTTLSTLVVLCSAYIAGNNIHSLRVCLGHAMRITREGFTTDLATEESFLFLVRWLGYIHIVALLDETDYSIDAPNYFNVAAKPDHVPPARGEFFQDVDPFLGISHSVADLLYRIGRILRTRNTDATTSFSESWKSDADSVEVETRMQLLLRRLRNHKKDNELRCHLDHYNESLLYSGFLRFLLEFKEESHSSTLVQSTISQILDSCAAVPADTPVAKLMLLPLFTAGSHTTRPLHHDFIRRRLEVVKSGQCIVNVTRLMDVLEERWREQKRGASDFMYSSLSLGVAHALSSVELTQASVCVLF
ncbi:fungal-specific transcription factor domain-containing protein [Aspergillus californicus]